MNKHIGSSFNDFLESEYIQESSEAEAVKRVIAWKLRQAIDSNQITKSELARRMKTSRSAVKRVLDPTSTGITLTTLEKAARASGMRLKMDLVAEWLQHSVLVKKSRPWEKRSCRLFSAQAHLSPNTKCRSPYYSVGRAIYMWKCRAHNVRNRHAQTSSHAPTGRSTQTQL